MKKLLITLLVFTILHTAETYTYSEQVSGQNYRRIQRKNYERNNDPVSTEGEKSLGE